MRIRVAVLSLALVGACGEPTPKRIGNPGPSVPTPEQRADNVVACGLALLQAEKRGGVASDAQLDQPWSLTLEPSDAAGRRVACKAHDQRGSFIVVVDVVCADVNSDRCHPLVRVDRN